MQLVGEFFKRGVRGKYKAEVEVDLPLPNALMGVEVEVDQDTSDWAVTFPTEFSPEWVAKHDGSLVNGTEYVLAFPLAGQPLVDSIYKLYSEPTKVKRTFTGSTHIHIDMMDNFDVEALRTLALMAYSLENILYAAGDMSRQWCGFANRLTSAPAEVLEHILAIDNSDNFNYNVTEMGRYYGLNLQALIKYGSAEFRYFPTAESADELIRWVKLVQLFKKAAQEIGTVDNMLGMFSTEQGYNDFIASYFSDYPAEVAAVGGYGRMKALVNKAMIILKSKGAKKKTSKGYTKAILEGKFKDLLTRATKKITNALIAVQINASGVSAPTPQRVFDDYLREFNRNPDLVLLVHGGSIYYASGGPGSNWDNATHIPHSPEFHGFTEQVLSLRAEIVSQLEGMGRNATARDVEYYMSMIEQKWNSINNPPSDDEFGGYDDEDEDY